MLTLYNAAHSTCSQKVRICLAEKDLPFADMRLDLGKSKDHLKPEYLKINPNGVVPTLVDDGDIITDSSVICEYLDEKYPSARLMRHR
jgi:glutathione S-transferase